MPAPESAPALFRSICITRLPPDLKRQVWAFIRDHRPDTAAMLTGADPQCPFAEMMALIPDSTIWLPVEDTGLSAAQVGSLSVSMVSWRGGGISTPTAMPLPEDVLSSSSAPKAKSRQTRR